MMFNSLNGCELNSLLHAAAIDNAEKVAVVDRERQLTYGDLEKYSNAVCNLLLKNDLARQNQNICLYFDNNAEKLICVEGTIKAGMTYVPFDVRAAEYRNAQILENVSGKVILTDEGDYEAACALAERANVSKENIIKITETLLKNGDHKFSDRKRSPDDLAYIIHTSGSTGKPKGVMVCDKALLNFCQNMIDHEYIIPEDRIGVLQNFSFDFSVLDMFPAMLCGATMVNVPEDVHRDIYRLNRFIEEKRITVQGMPTALYNLFLPLENNALKKLLVGGEKMLQYQKKSYDIYNFYGPTEAAVFVTACKVEAQTENISIGSAFDNVELFVVKEDNTLADVNEKGELCIQGVSLAAGYIHDEEETAKCFVPSVTDPSQIMYRTGDIGVRDENGLYYCLGRKDFQLKFNGYRIEPDEINCNVLKLEDIADSVVLLNDIPPQPYLVCFYCTKSKEEHAESEWKNALSTYLPQYMIPSRWIYLDQIPLNHNRKVDREALLEIAENRRNAVQRSGVTDTTESKVRKIWSELTGTDENFDADDTFNSIGGNSILGMIMLGKIREELGVEITPSEMFEAYTLRKFMDVVNSKTETSRKPETNTRNESERFKPFALNEMQRAYFIGRDESAGLGNIPTHIYFELIGADFNCDRFLNALEKVVSVHDALRIRVDEDGMQRTVPYAPGELDVTYKDIAGLSLDEQERLRQKIRDQLLLTKIDCAKEPPMKTVVLLTSKKSAVIMVYLDGMIADGWSQQIIIQDLCKYYDSPELSIDHTEHLFRDYNEYLQAAKKTEAYRKSMEYWEKHICELPDIPMLPLKCNPDLVETVTLHSLSRIIEKEEWDRFSTACRYHGVTSYAALITIFGNVLSKITKNNHFLVNVPVLRRFFKDISFDDIVGTCSSFALFDIGKASEISFAEETKKNYKKSADIVEHSLFSGIQIIKEIEKQRNRKGFSVPVVFTSNMDAPEIESAYFHQDWFETRTSQMWLDVFITEEKNRVRVIWNYVSELLDGEMMENMLDELVSQLKRFSDESSFNEAYEDCAGKSESEFAQYTAKSIADILSDSIDDCCVLIDKNSDRLKLYYTTDNYIEPEDIKMLLQEKLPPYMIPDDYTELLQIPRSESGKVLFEEL